MAIRNKTRYAIMGVLTVKNCSGYDIKKYCDRILTHFWNENFGHLYPVLKQLLSEGVIVKSDDASDSRKIIYSISEKGRQEFMEWLMKSPEYQPARSEFLLKLSFSNIQPIENTIQMIMDYRKMHLERLDKYLDMEKFLQEDASISGHSQKPYIKAPLRYGILSTRAVIEWCDEVVAMLNQA